MTVRDARKACNVVQQSRSTCAPVVVDDEAFQADFRTNGTAAAMGALGSAIGPATERQEEYFPYCRVPSSPAKYRPPGVDWTTRRNA